MSRLVVNTSPGQWEMCSVTTNLIPGLILILWKNNLMQKTVVLNVRVGRERWG